VLEIAEAQHRILRAFRPLPQEEVALADALGRHLAVDVGAPHDAPPFSNSAMDGYAVRAADVSRAAKESPVVLSVVGESKAGDAPDQALTPGTAMRIFTGAPVPAGADAIVIQEDTEWMGDSVQIFFAAGPGHHIRLRGEDTRAGSVLLPAGHVVSPGAIGLLASQGHGRVWVHRRPRVAILSTGDELRGVDDPETPGTIVDSNRYALAAQVEEAGGIPWTLPTVRDDLDAIVTALDEALSADLVLTTGGVSVGAHDHVRVAFARLGIEADFWKVRIKPGKPLTFGCRGETPVVGLPGNPVSAMVTFHVFVRPGLRRLLGDPRPHSRALPVRLGADLERRPGRPELVRATLETTANGTVAHLCSRQGSGALPSVALADALVLVPAEASALRRGTELMTLPFGPAPGAVETAFS
jgi:molybdopterin molybdotransferase